jgi:flagellar basal body-associated protein FliL
MSNLTAQGQRKRKITIAFVVMLVILVLAGAAAAVLMLFAFRGGGSSSSGNNAWSGPLTASQLAARELDVFIANFTPGQSVFSAASFIATRQLRPPALRDAARQSRALPRAQ